MQKSFYNLTFQDLREVLVQNNCNLTAANHLFTWHYKKRNPSPCLEKIAASTQNFLSQALDFTLPKIDQVHESQDGTVKFLFSLAGGHKVETVLIPFYQKYSICISSQVGCAMNCSFCLTATEGLKRNLSTAEMVGQYLVVWNWLKENKHKNPRILNIVFMGQGEPLHNFDSVNKACEIFLSQHGLSIGNQKITVSTAGYLPGLKAWAKAKLTVNLALSLHSTEETQRNELIPMNKKYPLDRVLAQIDQIPLQKKQFVTYEYLMIKGFNDSLRAANKLGELLQNKRAYINLIPFNWFEGAKYQAPEQAQIEKFKGVLDGFKIPTIIRTAKGSEVSAACGQLTSQNKS